MKIRFTLLFSAMIACQFMVAQVHITEADPATWSTEVLRPYLNQTVIFDFPMVVSSISGSKMVIGPWRRFQPENQGELGSALYMQTVHINNNLLELSGVTGTHRTGEHIYNLKVKVGSKPNEVTWISGTREGNSRAELQSLNLRRAVGIKDDCDSCLLVCGFNVENYFVTHLGSQYLGANSYAEHQHQRAKVHAALVKINADIYGLCELEQGDAAIKEIVDDLNKEFPKRDFQFFSKPSSGNNQKSDFIYDANLVEPIRTPEKTDVEVADRKKMVAFRHKKTGEKFIYSINHFKAMNTGEEYRREKESRAVIDLYNKYRQKSYIRDNDLLLMGDLNSYAKASPILIFTDHGFIDLHRAFHADSSYSYVYGGQAAYIDHAICSEPLFRQVTGMTAYHINSDEPSSNSYKNDGDYTMFRSSDHDPVVVGLRLDSTLSQVFDPYMSSAEFSADSVNFYYISTTEEPHMYFDIYTIDGHQIAPPTNVEFQSESGDSHTHCYSIAEGNPNLPEELRQFLPLPSGIYIIRFFFNGEIKAYKLIVR